MAGSEDAPTRDVAQIFNLPYRRLGVCKRNGFAPTLCFRELADYKSAIRQIENLRYAGWEIVKPRHDQVVRYPNLSCTPSRCGVSPRRNSVSSSLILSAGGGQPGRK